MLDIFKCFNCKFFKGFHEFCEYIDCSYEATSTALRFRIINKNRKVNCPKIKKP